MSAQAAAAAPREIPSGRLVLVRHGASLCNVHGVVGGRRGCTGLSETGLMQAKALRLRLERTGELEEATVLYASVLERAVQTADVIAPAAGGGLEVIEDCGLCELHPGDADGLTWEEVARRYGTIDFRSHPHQAIAPSGESWSGFVERASSRLAAIMDRHPGQLVVVVCHAGVVAASVARFLGMRGSSAGLGLRCENTSITRWDRDPSEGPNGGSNGGSTGGSTGGSSGGWTLVTYNDASHLE